MALNVFMISIQSHLIVVEKRYATIDQDACSELKNVIGNLNLGNLKHVDWVSNVIFSWSQCNEILAEEIPELRAAGLSESAQKAVEALENALKDVRKDVFTYLMLELFD